jgi:hypothetical protein
MRLRTWINVACLGMSVVIGAAWIASYSRAVTWQLTDEQEFSRRVLADFLVLSKGQLTFVRMTCPRVLEAGLRVEANPFHAQPLWPAVRHGLIVPGGGRELSVRLPLWMGLLPVAAPCVVGGVREWRTARRRRCEGCERCGYSLRGLPRAECCPECGWQRRD